MQNEKSFVNIIKFGLLVALFVPLYVGPQLIFPFVVPKTMAFVIIVDLLLIFYIPLAISSSRFRPKMNALFWAVTALYAIFIITAITGQGLYRSIWSTYERMGGVFVFTHYYLYFIILVGMLKKLEDWLLVLRTATIVGVMMSLYAIGQKMNLRFLVEAGQSRATGTIGNPIFLAAFLMFSFAFSLILVSDKSEGEGARMLYGAGALIIGTAIALTSSRGVLVALIGGVFLYGLIYLIYGSSLQLKKIASSVLIAILLFTGTLYALRNNPVLTKVPTLYRLSSIFQGSAAIKQRLYAWDIAKQGWEERFWLGWGPENFYMVYNKYFNPLIMESSGSEVWFDRSHNIIFDWAVTSGTIGLVIYLVGTLLMPLFFLYRGIKKKNSRTFNYYAIPFVFLLAYFVQNFFVFEMASSYLMFFLMLAFISFIVHKDGDYKIVPEADNHHKKRRLPNYTNVSVGVVGLMATIMGIFIYRVDIKIINAAYWTSQATQSGFLFFDANQKPAIPYRAVVDASHRSLSFNMFGDAEARMRYVSFLNKIVENFIANNKIDPNSTETQQVVSEIKYAIEETQKSIKTYPVDVRVHLDLGRLYNRMSAMDNKNGMEYLNKASKTFLKALELSSGREQTYYELANVEMMKNNMPMALEYLNKAVDLNPNVPESHWNRALVFSYLNRWPDAQSDVDVAIEKGFVYVNYQPHLDFLIQVYEQNKNNNKLISLYDLMIERDATNYEWYDKLAKAYYNSGNKDMAIKTANRIAEELSPMYEKQAKELIATFK